MAVCERAEAAGEDERDQGHREHRKTALHSAVAGDLLQKDAEEEEEDGETCVHGEGLEVSDGEVATREQLQLQHRLGDASLVGEEHGEGDDPAEKRDEDGRTRPAEARLLDQREDDPTEPQGAQDRTEVVDMAGRIARSSALPRPSREAG